MFGTGECEDECEVEIEREITVRMRLRLRVRVTVLASDSGLASIYIQARVLTTFVIYYLLFRRPGFQPGVNRVLTSP